jgi:nucleoside-diphosphate-sugar epimerase
MRRVLIAGCGYLGIATAWRFRSGGWEVVGWTRSGNIADRELADAIEHAAIDLSEPHQVERNRFPCDLVVHCASSSGGGADEYRRIYRDGAENLARFFPETRLIFTSSTSVYPQRDGSWVDENSPAEPQNEKAKILRAAEEIVLGAGGIVLRLGGIYGPERSFFLRSVKNGHAAIAAPDRYVNQIHRDDAAAAIWFLAQRPEIAPPCIFNVVDDAPVSRGEIFRWLSAQLKVPLSDSTRAPSTRRGETNKRVSNARLRSLGWEPRYRSYAEGLSAMLDTASPPSGPHRSRSAF